MNQDEELSLAISMAHSAHSGQTRKDGVTPYILHPLAVMLEMKTHEERIVALLHDVIEDSTLYDLQFIHDNFGTEVAAAVKILTKFDKQERYQVYIMRLAQNPLATRVKIQDIKHNMSTLDSIPNDGERDHLEKRWNWALIYLEERVKCRCKREYTIVRNSNWSCPGCGNIDFTVIKEDLK